MNNDRVHIHLDELHRTLMLPASEFDLRISQTSDFKLSQIFEDHVNSSGCKIKLNNQSENQQLLATLEEFKDVFKLKPHEDGIDCNPMDIDFYDEDTVVYRPPRRLNPERLKIANQIFDELIKSGFATESNVYPDHRKPRLTGDFSGPNGVNANTIPIAPNLPKISDVLEFLSQILLLAASFGKNMILVNTMALFSLTSSLQFPKELVNDAERALRYTSHPNRIMHRELLQKQEAHDIHRSQEPLISGNIP
ncbi:hypothetical protein P9112_011244 [Eukaryota sp. TZLM1-RC]